MIDAEETEQKQRGRKRGCLGVFWKNYKQVFSKPISRAVSREIVQMLQKCFLLVNRDPALIYISGEGRFARAIDEKEVKSWKDE